VRGQFDVPVDLPQPLDCGDRLWRAALSVPLVKEHLALQVAPLDDISVHEIERADAEYLSLVRRLNANEELAEKRQRADAVLDNSGTLAETRRKVAALLAGIETEQ